MDNLTQQKHTKYDEVIVATGCKFFAVVINMYGTFAPEIDILVRMLQRHVIEEHQAAFRRQMIVSIARAVAAGNADMVDAMRYEQFPMRWCDFLI